jgi:hypothetical protein
VIKMTRVARLAVLFVALLLVAGAGLAQTTPEKFFGFAMGADRQLADYTQIRAYLDTLAKESPRLRVFNLGPTTLGKPMVMAAISSEANIAKLERYVEISKRLRDPRTLPLDEARKLAQEGKVLLLITCSIHATEIAASQMAMELAYKLVSGNTPIDRRALDDVIVLLIPTINPDGHQMVTEWYRTHVGTKYEGGAMPWLYHPYAGHDDNRDWFMFDLAETRAVTKVLYHDFVPQVNIDEHQMGSTGARLFLPPYMDPPTSTIDPLVWRSIDLLGTAIAYDMQRQGFKGLVHGRSYTGWWIGSASDTSWLHGTVGLLSEMASARIASPVYIEPGEIPQAYAESRMEFIDPWPGGWWRLRNLVDYELAMTFSLINTVSHYRQDLLMGSYQLARRAIENTDKGQPFAFVIPARQHDPLTALKMIDILIFGGVEVQRATADFVADGRSYPTGSYVVKMAQPYKAYAWALLDRQEYPDLREYAGGPPVPPYDNAGWTLPLQMGVACERIAAPFEAKLEHIAKVAYPAPDKGTPGGAYLVLDARANASYAVAANLLRDKAELWRARTAIRTAAIDVPAGSFVIKATPEVGKALPPLFQKYHLATQSLADTKGLDLAPLKRFRVGLYQSWRGNMDEGWTRFLLDDAGIPYTTLHNDAFKGAKDAKVDLRASWDAIVFADESADIIKTGKPAPGGERGRGFGFSSPMPPEYEGGIEKEGVEALKAFVERGGILVLLNRAGELAMREWDVPARNAIDKIERTKFFCPTSLVNIEVDNQTPIGWGMPNQAAAMFASSLAFETWAPNPEWDRRVVARFPEKNVLASGWLLGEEMIARKAAVVDVRYQKGHIVLIGIRCQHRAQAYGTYKLLLNSLLYPEE